MYYRPRITVLLLVRTPSMERAPTLYSEYPTLNVMLNEVNYLVLRP